MDKDGWSGAGAYVRGDVGKVLWEVLWELAFFDSLGELNENVEGVCLEAWGLTAAEGSNVVHYGLWGESVDFVGATAAAFIGDVREAIMALPLAVVRAS